MKEAMKIPAFTIATIVIILFYYIPVMASARHVKAPPHGDHNQHYEYESQPSTRQGSMIGSKMVSNKLVDSNWETRSMSKRKRADTLKISGSSFPDCSHACMSCTPCRLVIVSFVCSSLEEAETCPMAYKCMCNHKSYPVP